MCGHNQKYRNRNSLKVILALSTLLCDQVSKIIVMRTIPLGVSLSIIPGVLSLTPTENRGIAFGVFSAFNSLFLSLLSLAIVVLLIYFWHRHSPYLYLIVGGALGNIIDRLRYGYVLDFIHIRYWPVFNLADISIFFGVVLTIFSVVIRKGGKENAPDTF